MGIFAKIAAGLRKTKDNFLGRLKRIFNSFTKIDEELFEELEEAMIMSDIGVETSEEICDQLRKKIKERGITDPNDIMDLIQEVIGEMMGDDTGLDLTQSPAVIMVIGVNGAGKTTTIGKLCYQFKNEGKKVLVAAADTFRAAAIDQLEVWTERAGVELVKHAEGSDPGAVVYDALEAAKARECDVVIIDTAGRLHNKKNLMDELAKINRIIDNKAGECSREVLLVLDATTGQNAVNQAKLFSETAPITGIVLTKLDGTAKGGIVISIKNELGIPVKLIGVGEKIDDLQPFDSRTFVQALFSDNDFEEEEEETEEITEDTEYEDEEYDDEYEDSEEEYEDEYEYEDDSDEDDDEDDEEGAREALEQYLREHNAELADDEDDEDEPEGMIQAEGYTYNTNYMDDFDEDDEEEYEEEDSDEDEDEYDYDEESDEEYEDEDEEYDEDDDTDEDDSDEEDSEDAEEDEEEEPEKKKKKGFFRRLFGRKDEDDD
ncbi:MAG: signal recognition particle-docking protein FtsY [Ruminococcus sp.]|nr:signal recognition particle-docking protein FtsY [Ruminococcus sp.]